METHDELHAEAYTKHAKALPASGAPLIEQRSAKHFSSETEPPPDALRRANASVQSREQARRLKRNRRKPDDT
jgi:hypothetical protein